MNKEISFYEFTQLSDEEQYELVFKEGEFLNYSIKNDLRFTLYKLKNFFVEVVYDARENKIVNLSSFMNAKN
ncbi:hypothetical protein [Chryseobacterium sp. FH1]|uniref:hypothetical protein n=1 Tax=Chryseobacterium sp. FH1 TaxID=1233951 RepID=UPI0004E44095|nr:hypothetical protein [Chryseobacterium sp. FH1]KFC19694.1 hypothetical protein IO90_10530 [Chryseobacterium sp. FH1]